MSNVVITLEKTKYNKSGKRWIAAETETKQITRKQFDLICKNKMRGDRYTYNYTMLGYVPTDIHSYSPDKTRKSVYRFSFKSGI